LHLLCILGEGTQAHFCSPRIHLFLIFDWKWLQFALFIGMELRSIKLWTPLADAHPILKIGNILRIDLFRRLRSHQDQTGTLKVAVAIGMLHQEPGHL
jgi:hypothetical protein